MKCVDCGIEREGGIHDNIPQCHACYIIQSEPQLFEVSYKLTTMGMCCGSDTDYYDSLDDLVSDNMHQSGDVTMQVKEDCGHWDDKVEWEMHTIEFYEIAEYLDEWGVDTLDSDRFIVYTDGTWKRGPMLKILEHKSGTV